MPELVHLARAETHPDGAAIGAYRPIKVHISTPMRSTLVHDADQGSSNIGLQRGSGV